MLRSHHFNIWLFNCFQTPVSNLVQPNHYVLLQQTLSRTYHKDHLFHSTITPWTSQHIFQPFEGSYLQSRWSTPHEETSHKIWVVSWSLGMICHCSWNISGPLVAPTPDSLGINNGVLHFKQCACKCSEDGKEVSNLHPDLNWLSGS